MIRVVVFLVLVGLFAIGAAWLADRPGEVAITWFGYHIQTSIMVVAVAIALLMVATVVVWSLFRFILNSPYLLSRFISDRRGARGYQALSKGLIAVGAGDVRSARKFATEARRIAGGEPLALLLTAQTAQLTGDRTAAEEAFRAMASRPDTKLLGLHGLFVEARRRGDTRTAAACAEEAALSGPTPGWAGQAVLEMRCATSDWAGALEAVERNHRSGLIDKPTYRRHRAVLLTAQAIAADESDRDRAKPLALDALKLEPTLVPAAVLAGRLLGESSELRKASRIVERAWRDHPHPDLAETYAYLRVGDSARERLARVRTLTQRTPGHIESVLALARAAIDAQEFSVARAALQPHLRLPTQRVAMLMAELDQAEHGDVGRARAWTARAVHAQRDPAWTADGMVSDRWLPVSPVTGRLDAFEWRVPVAELAPPQPQDFVDEEEPALIAAPVATPEASKPEPAAAPAVEPEQAAVETVEAAPLAPEKPAPAAQEALGKATPGKETLGKESPPKDVRPQEINVKDAAPKPTPSPQPSSNETAPSDGGAKPERPKETADAPGGGRAGRSKAAVAERAPRKVEPIDPLVRAPDDPGPEPQEQPAADRRQW